MNMEETKIVQMADFLSIAIEELESENSEIALDFVKDVHTMLLDEIDDL